MKKEQLLSAFLLSNIMNTKQIFLFFNCLYLFFSLSIWTSQYNVINDVEIDERSFEGWKGDIYIKPNELQPMLFASSLEDREGILLSVGTFRAFEAFSMGKFTYLIMMDFSSDILDYNRKQLDLIKKIVEQHPNDPHAQMTSYKNDDLTKEYLDEYDGFFYQNTEKWNKITQAILDGRVYVVKADLLNWRSNEMLNKAINTFDGAPLTFDISNVIDYTGDSYYNLADTMYFLSHDDAKENLQAIDDYWESLIESESFVLPFDYDKEDRHAVILTSLSLCDKKIPAQCQPNFLGKHEHGSILFFSYYYSSLKSFLKYLRADIGVFSQSIFPNISCDEVSVEYRNYLRGKRQALDGKYFLKWPGLENSVELEREAKIVF